MFKRLILLTTVEIVIVILIVTTGCSSAIQPVVTVKAAIIDQLSAYPNKLLISDISTMLQDKGFFVDKFSGNEITVDFFRTLPSKGYKLIIFRVHSGLLAGNTNNPGIEGKTWLFTNEPYSKTKYLADQLADRLTFGQTSRSDPRYFAVGSKFIKENTLGKFNGSMIIFMGCDSFHLMDIISAFIDKGASVCLGWDLSVGLKYVDDATRDLIEKLCTGNIVKAATAGVMAENGPSEYNAVLQYFPESRGDKTLKQLLSAK